MLVFFESLGLGLGLGLDLGLLSPYPKTQKKQAPNPNPSPKYTKIFGFKKKNEKIYSLKYLDINEIFLKPKNVWVFGFGAFFGGVLWFGFEFEFGVWFESRPKQKPKTPGFTGKLT